MPYVRLLLDLLAIVGGSSILAFLSPWQVTARVIPLLIFVTAMIVMVLPTLPLVALAMMLPTALIQKLLGIKLTGHEPLDVVPAIEKAKSAAESARERFGKSKPAEVTQFVTRAFPHPDQPDEAELADDEAAVDDDAPEDEPAPSPVDQARERLTAITRGKPSDWYGQKLTGQRAGRGISGGLRSAASQVPKFVPAL